MFYITGDPKRDLERNIKSNACFQEADRDLPGYNRFFSCHRRFPISIRFKQNSYPQFNFDRDGYIELVIRDNFQKLPGFSEDFWFVKVDLRLTPAWFDHDAVQRFLAGQCDVLTLIEDMLERNKRSGDIGNFKMTGSETGVAKFGTVSAPGAVWAKRKRLGGEIAVMQSAEAPEVVWLSRQYIETEERRHTYHTMLQSLSWLDADFFHSLPVQPNAVRFM